MAKPFQDEKRILPDFPRTPHLPYQPNAQQDLIAPDRELVELLSKPEVTIEDKIDGASCGMVLYEEHPLIRNANHILRKGYCKDTPAKQQFVPVWTWFYKNIDKFRRLEQLGPFSVYGEWTIAQHGLEYDLLPDWFIAHDLYDYEVGKFVDPKVTRRILTSCGFTLVPLLHQGPSPTPERMLELTESYSEFSTKGKREGIYLKVGDEKHLTHRYKLVRADFVQGALWSDTELKRNALQP